MKVLLLNNPTLEFVDSAVGMCWDKGSYDCNTDKGKSRIDRVCNKFKHNSLLRFANYIYYMELSTSALLELSRHTQAVNLSIKSTRYCTKQNPDDILMELSGNDKVNQLIFKHVLEIKDLISKNKSLSNDDIKLLLPQAFIYKGQIQFNAQSLQHFLSLRTDPSSHIHIRNLAYEFYNKLPEDHKYLFKDFVHE